ncbi:MAG: glycerophosphodiester phosphodiesterase [Firmicutes bacterium]|nr:glycerophosphodiester phosphodiesterase [Bacillota bacterium]
MTIVLVILVVLAVLYLLATRCRCGHPGMEALRGWSYAHRGLHGDGVPENSMKAFRLALEAGYGIELDLHLLKDGNLAVIHDSLLVRTTGAEGHIEDLTTEELKNYTLEGTEEIIPQFKEVLDLFAGKAPLIVELKAERGNHAALTETAVKMLEAYDGVYCIESFDPRCILWLKKNRPEIIRGQLSQNFVKKNENLSLALRIALTHLLTNFLTVPDFVAYNFAHRKDTGANTICRKFWKGQGVSWTLRTKEEYDQAVKEGLLPIFESFRP